MSKAQRKGKKHDRRPNIPVATSLRPRLSALFGDPALPGKGEEMIGAELDVLVEQVRPEVFLPALAMAYAGAPAAAQAALDPAIPAWLRARGLGDTLRVLLNRGVVAGDHEELVIGWLGAAGEEVGDLAAAEQQSTFHRAFVVDNAVQAMLLILYYTNRTRTRVKAMGFLIDYQPPWDGAVKDVVDYPQRTPEAAIRDFVDPWRRRTAEFTGPLAEVDAAEAKARAVRALLANRKARIRLPADMMPVRDLFVRHVLTLPDGPETPLLSAEDVAELSMIGDSPEALSAQEKTFGYRTRLDDGSEILLLREPPFGR